MKPDELIKNIREKEKKEPLIPVKKPFTLASRLKPPNEKEEFKIRQDCNIKGGIFCLFCKDQWGRPVPVQIRNRLGYPTYVKTKDGYWHKKCYNKFKKQAKRLDRYRAQGLI